MNMIIFIEGIFIADLKGFLFLQERKSKLHEKK